jgi:hypothetical protein
LKQVGYHVGPPLFHQPRRCGKRRKGNAVSGMMTAALVMRRRSFAQPDVRSLNQRHRPESSIV